MGGYAASARIERPRVRTGRSRPAPSGLAGGAGQDLEVEELTPSRMTRVAELLEDLRTAWRQTTFYLFDPQSWR